MFRSKLHAVILRLNDAAFFGPFVGRLHANAWVVPSCVLCVLAFYAAAIVSIENGLKCVNRNLSASGSMGNVALLVIHFPRTGHSANIVTTVFSTMVALVRSVAVHSMKTSLVCSFIFECSPLMIGGRDKTTRLLS